MMKARTLDDVETFLEEASPLLLDDEPRHNLILGLASTIRDAPGLYPEPEFWVVHERGEAAAAALRTPPYNLVLARPRRDAALDVLVAAVGGELPGVLGAVPEVDALAQRWSKRYGRSARLDQAMGLHVLESVRPVPVPAGSVRAAAREDRALLLDWWGAFGREALASEEQDHARDARAVDHRLDDEHAGVVLWEDEGAPVSFAAYGGPTPNGIRVGPVYTPPALRGRGYATALVAELSARLLAQGRRFCFLYTDLANPTANAIYERIGYVRVCDSKQLAFG